MCMGMGVGVGMGACVRPTVKRALDTATYICTYGTGQTSSSAMATGANLVRSLCTKSSAKPSAARERPRLAPPAVGMLAMLVFCESRLSSFPVSRLAASLPSLLWGSASSSEDASSLRPSMTAESSRSSCSSCSVVTPCFAALRRRPSGLCSAGTAASAPPVGACEKTGAAGPAAAVSSSAAHCEVTDGGAVW